MTKRPKGSRGKRLQADSPRCSSLRKDGKPCRGFAVSGTTTCLSHSPKYRKRLVAARKKGGRTRVSMLRQADLGIGELDWKTPEGLLAIMAGAAEQMMMGKLDPSRARTLADMATKILGVLSHEVMDKRLEAVERTLAALKERARGN